MNAKRIWSMLVVWALCVVLSQAGAQKTMSVLNTWLQHDVTVDDLKGMMVHGTLKVDGYKDSQMKLTAYIYHAPGKMMPDQNGKYCSANGKVAASMEFTPESDSELYGSMAIFFPYDEMHLNEGTHTYYCRLHLIAPDNTRAYGDYMQFEGTVEPQKKTEFRDLQVLKTSLEHGVYQEGIQGMKVCTELKMLGCKNRELEISAKFFDSDKQPLKSGSTMVDLEVRKVFIPHSDEIYLIKQDFFVPYLGLPLKAGTNTYYCRVSLTDSESIYTVGDYVSFEGTAPVKKVVEVVKTWIEHGVTQNGTNGIKVHSELKVHGYKGQEVEYVIGLYDENKNPHKNPIGITKLIPSYDHSEWKDASIFIPLGDLALKEGKHTYYCIANVVAGDGTRGIGEFVSFDGTGPVKKVVEVVNTWIEHGVTQNGTNGIKVHSELKVHGYKGQEVEYVIGLYDENKNPHKNPIGITKLIPSYDHSEWKDASIFIPLRDLALKEGKHTYYCIANVVAGDGTRGIGEFVSFDGTGAAQNQPQHNHNHNHGHNHNHNAPNHSGGKLQQAPVYHGKREGRYYYISETYQQGSFNFYFLSGEYVADAPGLHNVYGALTRYIMTNETADYYIFKQAKVLFNGGFEFLDYAPQMKISKGWNYILIEKASPLDRSDLVYVKEISKEDYDEISRNKQAYLNRIGVSNGGNNNGGSSVDMSPNNSHIDKNCQYCGGGGGCSSCNGTGLKYNPYGGYYEECPSCRGSKRCFNCRGTGKQATY